MSRSFRQFSDTELRVLQLTTTRLAATCAGRMYKTRKRAKAHCEAESDLNRYKRSHEAIQRELRRRGA